MAFKIENKVIILSKLESFVLAFLFLLLLSLSSILEQKILRMQPKIPKKITKNEVIILRIAEK
jgi:hypothetical protein